MKNMFYAKELSMITKVSIRTLHYYDKIGLLQPSARLPNGYRIYSDNDLIKLEQIIALKYFGFNLSQIMSLLHDGKDMLTSLKSRLKLLEEEIAFLENIKKNVIIVAIADLESGRSINWRKIVQEIQQHVPQSISKKIGE